MFVGSLIVFGSILGFTVTFFVLMNSKWFERKFFRVDSDNVSWMLGSAILFLIGVAMGTFMDWSITFSQSPQYIFGVFIGIGIFIVGAVASWQKAKNLAHKKQTIQSK
jgi:predicted tellurium resistance membrane protein TerC